MLLILLGAAACLLWMGFSALAQGSNGLEQPANLWVADQVDKRKLVNFDERCGKTLDPIKGDDVHWADPCRTVAAADLRKVILAEDSHPAGVRLLGVHVTGTLDLSDAEIKEPLVIRSSRFDGGIDLTQARLLRALDIQNTRLEEFNAGGLYAEKRVSITSSLIRKKTNIHNAKIDSNFSLMDSTFEDSIDGTGLEISRNLSMLRGTFNGAVRLSDAKIGGNVDMEKATFEKTINAARLQIIGSLFMNNHAKFNSKLVLNYAMIGGNVEMEGGSEFVKIEAESIQISHHLFMGANSIFHDQVYMPFLHVAGYMDLRQGVFAKLDMSGSIIGQELRLSSEGKPPLDAKWHTTDEISPVLTLSNAQAGTIQDSLTAWPARVDLEGFIYSRPPGHGERTVEQWENWLQKSTYGEKHFNPQPYTQLSKILTEAGYRDQGLALQFAAREGERWQAARNGDWAHWFGLSALRWVSGYGIGKYTFIAVPWVLGSVVIGLLALRRSRAARANGVLWCIGASTERLLPIIELNKEFSEFFFDPHRERLHGWQLAFFGLYGLWGWVLGLLLIAAMSGLTQGS